MDVIQTMINGGLYEPIKIHSEYLNFDAHQRKSKVGDVIILTGTFFQNLFFGCFGPSYQSS